MSRQRHAVSPQGRVVLPVLANEPDDQRIDDGERSRGRVQEGGGSSSGDGLGGGGSGGAGDAGEPRCQEHEASRSRGLPVPRAPSQLEYEEHMLTHYPYRSWCPHCVRGRGRRDAQGHVDNPSSIPVLGAD